MHTGISLDFIDELTRHESLFIVILSAFIVLLGISTAIILGVGFSRPIQQLVTATREIGRGNFLYRIRTARNDEFGDLAESFNYMAEELQQKLEIQKSFGQYVSPDIVEMILKNPEGGWLKGAKGEVSILFADVRGFTSFSETRDPEHVVEELNEYFAVATTAILDHGGYVDKFIGDAVLGVFGAPVHREDHIERAVNAAMQMQESFARRAKETGHYVCGHIGVALHSGEVVSGNIGSEVKMEYTVIGDHVNLASRLNGLAESGEIVISETVYSAVADRFQVEDMPAATLKGKSKPVKVFKITGYK
jgi:adenylate cyclase